MSLQNTQVEFAELIVANEQTTNLITPASHIVIYHNNYMAHLMNTLSDIYPMLGKLVGDEAFKALARDYIQQYPSGSGDLNAYGAYVSHFVAEYTPATHLPYLAEVASFEWLVHSLQSMADVVAFDPTALRQVPIDQYSDLRFIINPASCIQVFHYPILDIIELCHNRLGKIDTLNAPTLYLFISRRDNEMVLTPISQSDYLFLDALQNNQTLGAALELALDVDSDFDLNERLTDWIKNNTIIDFISPN